MTGYEAARAGAALEASVAADALDLAGDDRVRFLHNLTTADVRALVPGESARAFVTTAQGKIVASADVVALEDRLRLVLPAGTAAATEAHLSRYRIVERVEISAPADLAFARLRGALSPQALIVAKLPAPEGAGAHVAVGEGEETVRVRRLALGREPPKDRAPGGTDRVPARSARRDDRLALPRRSRSNGRTMLRNRAPRARCAC